jgi:adenylate cyclase
MNDYFGAVFAPVRYHGGIVSDVKGDSMLALWPTPFPDPAVRRKTCLAALDIAAAVHRFNRLLEARVHPQAGVPQFPTRIGLDAGRMSIGTIGAIDHYEYRAVGPAVNTVERIESLNKHLGTRILASEEVLSQLKGFLIRELGSFLLLGKTTPVAVHELMCPEEESSDLQRRLCAGFTGALQAFRSRAWEEAIGEFTNCMKMQVQDGPSLFYIHLCESLRANPPGEDWDGVVRLDRK